jgi:hypothetical protein
VVQWKLLPMPPQPKLPLQLLPQLLQLQLQLPLLLRSLRQTPRSKFYSAKPAMLTNEAWRAFSFWTPLKMQISSQLLRCGKNFLLAY